jgi:hypothetical protein
VTLCVYALTGPQPLAAVRGLAGERLQLVTAGAIGAIAGEVARAPRPNLANLRLYDRAIRRIHLARPAVLPVRFGTCFDSVDELRQVLRSRQAGLRGALRRVRHRAQMTFRVPAGGAESALRPSSRAAPGVRRGGGRPAAAGSGARYLRTRAAEAAREREVPGFDGIRRAVARWVRAERVEKRRGVASVYVLVPLSSAAAFRRAAERAAAESGLRMVVTGPWPPYAFADATDLRTED